MRAVLPLRAAAAGVPGAVAGRGGIFCGGRRVAVLRVLVWLRGLRGDPWIGGRFAGLFGPGVVVAVAGVRGFAGRLAGWVAGRAGRQRVAFLVRGWSRGAQARGLAGGGVGRRCRLGGGLLAG